MIEEVCGTHYQAINLLHLGVLAACDRMCVLILCLCQGRTVWKRRAEGELAEKLMCQIRAQAGNIQDWLAERL